MGLNFNSYDLCAACGKLATGSVETCVKDDENCGYYYQEINVCKEHLNMECHP